MFQGTQIKVFNVVRMNPKKQPHIFILLHFVKIKSFPIPWFAEHSNTSLKAAVKLILVSVFEGLKTMVEIQSAKDEIEVAMGIKASKRT